MKINKNVYVLLENLKAYSLETYNHSIEVSKLCTSFGRYLGLSNEEIDKLRLAGLLHDIGKLCIPLKILHKPSSLTKEEFNILKIHPLYSVKLLIQADFTCYDVLSIIINHHEKINGLGYPYGLDDSSIPDLAKILAICDSYDAMKSKRVYKDAKNTNYIKKELINNACKQFDYYYVNMFLDYLNLMDNKKRFCLSNNLLVSSM